MAAGLGVPGPVVRRPTRFHEDQRGGLLGKEALKSLTSQPMPLSYLPGVFRDGDLKYRLRHVDRDRRTIHIRSSFRDVDARRLWHIDAVRVAGGVHSII